MDGDRDAVGGEDGNSDGVVRSRVLDWFDFKEPDYDRVWDHRESAIRYLRANRSEIAPLKAFYRENPGHFINDWGTTFDPRNIEVGRPALIPFVLFTKQWDWIDWAVALWLARRSGLTEKSRELGLSWLSISLACTLCLHYESMSIGFGAHLKDYVDKTGDPKSVFGKGRIFMDNLPPEFNGGWNPGDATYMQMRFRATRAVIGGQAGDDIGRGDRRGIYFVDESAHLEHPHLVDAALSMTTNCRIDISSVNGRANTFAEKRFSGNLPVFTFHWREDPRKDDAWYEKKARDLASPVVVAQELDIDYSASTSGVLIPAAWVQAAVGSGDRLHFPPEGLRFGSLDVADEGRDLNAFCLAHGVVVQHMEEWAGKGSDIYETVAKAFNLCAEHDATGFKYDADGLGAGVRGDSRALNEIRKRQNVPRLLIEAFQGSGAVFDPEGEDVKGRKNKDFFANAKAQAWWRLRTRFQKTYRRIVEGIACDPSEMISLRHGLPLLAKLMVELSQPTYSLNGAGKVLVDKAPDNTRSPNLADAVMIRFSSLGYSLVVPEAYLAKTRVHTLRTRRPRLR